MGATRDFVSATVADALLPTFRRPVEDIIYETLDRRQVPTRTDFKEMRDLLNNLRGQVSGTSNGIRKVVERSEEAEDTLDALQSRLDALESRFAALGAVADAAKNIESRIAKLEREQVTLARFSATISALQANIPAAVTPQQLEEAIAALRSSQPAAAPAAVPQSTEKKNCHVDDCDTVGRARGFCSRHYAQWRRGNLNSQFVTLEGDVCLDENTKVAVGEQHAAAKYTVEQGQIWINGAAVANIPA